jgi:hypothetical protein
MTEMTKDRVKPNAELAWRVLDHIDAHPEQWNQGLYIGKAECGTVGCFAGWTVLLSGAQPIYGATTGYQTAYIEVDGRFKHVGDYAEELLGVSRWADEGTDEEWDLFHEGNTREDLERLVGQMFGPRPTASTGRTS